MASDLGSSQAQLVGSRAPSKLPQFLTAIVATMGSVAMGAILGYSSPANAMLGLNDLNETSNCSLPNDEPLSETQLSWFSSTVNIGALVGAPLGGFLISVIGRRGTMISSISPFLLGWILIGAGTNFAMLVAGRIFCGVCCGLVSLSVPTYLGEIASTDIRGILGSGFQLMVTIGILYTYAVGAGVCWQWLALACLAPAIIFSVGMIFSQESPAFLLAKNRVEDARKSLQYFRGKDYDVTPELEKLHTSILEGQAKKASFKDLLKPHVLKPFLISLTLMFFQQFSGINAILFNLTTIFDSANVALSADASSIIVAATQVVATGVAAVLMDRAGRKLLLCLSAAAMCLSLIAMGVFFYLKEQVTTGKVDETTLDSLGWLPLTSLIVFIAFFSIGYGPIPWLMMGELLNADVRELASSIAVITNWGLSFVVTLIFAPLQNALHDSGVYWMFAFFCGLSFVFSLLIVKETKGKTLDEIAEMFGGPPALGGASDERRSSDSNKF